MPRPTIRFQIESPLQAEYSWIIRELGRFAGFQPVFTEEAADVTISELGISDIQVSHFFRSQYLHGDFGSLLYFDKEPLHFLANGKPDYLSTCFYMLSCLQEYAPFKGDKYGRFPLAESWQSRLNAIEENIVAKYFTLLCKSIPAISQRVEPRSEKSQLLLTHDIDTLFGAVGEQWLPLLKRGRIGDLLQLIFNHYLKQPDYMLLDRILDMEDEHDVRSVFFWITEEGRGRNGIDNADYDIDDPRVRRLLKTVRDRGSINGLHKSALKSTYTDELSVLNEDGIVANRNHYLRFFMPDTWNALENAGVQIDMTLGFPERPGFRSGYGLPFYPFNLDEKRAYNTIEAPLIIMDTSYKYYMNLSVSETRDHLISFLDNNKENTLLNILWHNNYFFNRLEPGWLNVYKDVLMWASESQIASTNMNSLLESFSLERNDSLA